MSNKDQFLIDNPNGRWDDCVRDSDWHWDYSQRGYLDYVKLCTFRGNWDDLVQKYLPLCIANTIAKKNGDAGVGTDAGVVCGYDDRRRANYCIVDQDMISDHTKAGINLDQEIFSRTAVGHEPIFQAMAEALGLREPDIWLTNQRPGQMFQHHVDKLGKLGREYRYTNPHGIKRFMIALEDWKLGQAFNFGNHFWQWGKGQCVVWDWHTVPHGTANFGWWDRPMITVTGICTDKTHQLIADASFDNVFLV